jgi:spore germination protein YaaH
VQPAQDPGYTTFAAHASELDVVHPIWWHVHSAKNFVPILGADDPTITQHTTLAGARTQLIPVLAAVDGSDPATVSAMLHDATVKGQHIAAIVSLVMAKGYDGIDLDYEHLPTSDASAYSAFVADLAAALHAKQKSLGIDVGGMTGPGNAFWDYDALSAVADQIHIMGYDFHFLGSHLGPVAPLGWVQKIVTYVAGIAGGSRKSKFILGLPNYGLAGTPGGISTWAGSLQESSALAGPGYSVVTDHMLSCPFVNPKDPIAPGRAPNALTTEGQLFFDDLASLEEKVVVAQNGGLGGITYFTIGGEPDQPGRTFFDMVRSHFPQ